MLFRSEEEDKSKHWINNCLPMPLSPPKHTGNGEVEQASGPKLPKAYHREQTGPLALASMSQRASEFVL